jgi:hypothetical protein
MALLIALWAPSILRIILATSNGGSFGGFSMGDGRTFLLVAGLSFLGLQLAFCTLLASARRPITNWIVYFLSLPPCVLMTIYVYS